ncbi:ATP-binding protein [Nonomuraea sp. NN258]|uniref:ATP-binding protein n=1 Tax=Nonomuraea antri TaxID=2730852 RepID=UPI0015694D12|nr:ATP-binding protein [Nonomuraea antri]NRQ32116.1 ATP-binding protein [Nonomuraea antri]
MIALLTGRGVDHPPSQDAMPDAWRLRTDDQAPKQARKFLREKLRTLRLPSELVEDAMLMVSELVTNAVRYGEPPLELAVSVEGDQVICQVLDVSPDTPSPQRETALVEHGRGLNIVKALSQGRYGWHAAPFVTAPDLWGKATWFGLPLNDRCGR